MKTLLNIIIALITLGVPAYIVFRARPHMPTGRKWLIYFLDIGVTWILIILANEISVTLDIRFASTPEAAQYFAAHDSGPRVGVLVGGWLPASVYVGLLAGIKRAIKK